MGITTTAGAFGSGDNRGKKVNDKDIEYKDTMQISCVSMRVHLGGIGFNYKEKYQYDIPLKPGSYALLFLEIDSNDDALSHGMCYYFRTGENCKHGKRKIIDHNSIKTTFHHNMKLIYNDNELIDGQKMEGIFAHTHFIAFVNDKGTKALIRVQDTSEQIDINEISDMVAEVAVNGFAVRRIED